MRHLPWEFTGVAKGELTRVAAQCQNTKHQNHWPCYFIEEDFVDFAKELSVFLFQLKCCSLRTTRMVSLTPNVVLDLFCPLIETVMGFRDHRRLIWN